MVNRLSKKIINWILKHKQIRTYVTQKLFFNNEIKNELDDTSYFVKRQNTITPGRMMNKLLLCAFNLWRMEKCRRDVTVHIITDNSEKYPENACRRILSIWDNWVSVLSHQIVQSSISEEKIQRWSVTSGNHVLGLVEDEILLKDLRMLFQKNNLSLIEPSFPPVGTLDSDLLREVSHFDFEIGGKNEWDGQPTKFSSQTLKLLSAENCRDYYPHWGLNDFCPNRDPMRVLDVGCGPISVLRWGAIQNRMIITGVDPLLDMYSLVRARHGYDTLPNIRCHFEIPSFAEEIYQLIPDKSFDLIYSQNSLDHTNKPKEVLDIFSKKLSPGGRIIIQVATKEGSRQNWDQFHKTDIYLNGDTIVYRRKNLIEKPLLSNKSNLRIKKINLYSADWLAVTLEEK